MSDIDVLVIRPPRFYTDGVTPAIFPEEILPSTILEENSISSLFLNADFARRYKKFGLYSKIEDYTSYRKRLKQFTKENNVKWIYTEKNIRRLNPKIILLIMRMPNDFLVTLRTAKIAKQISPNIKVGVWRSGNDEYRRAISLKLLRDKSTDFTIVSEIEHTILEVSKKLLKENQIRKVRGLGLRNKNDSIIFTDNRKPESNLDKFPIVNKDLVVDKKYYSPENFGLIEGGRGCIYECNFCLSRKTPFRLRAPEKVVKEISESYLKYGTREFSFLMSSFLHSKKWAIDVCNLIKKYGLNIIFGCYVNVNQVDREIIKTLRSAGCYTLGIGIESGNCNTLRSMGKISNFDINQIKESAKIIKSSGIFLRAGIIIGNPDESLGDIKKSLELLAETSPDFFRVQFLVPFMGTRIYDELKSKKMIIDENIDEYHTGEIKVKTEIDPNILKKIWLDYAKLSDLSESIIIRKKLFNYKIMRCKIAEHLRYFISFLTRYTPR